MDHVVCLDYDALEIENLISGKKSMIIRGADVVKSPYGIVREGDNLYFINNNGDRIVKARGIVSHVINSEQLSSEESFEIIIMYQDKLQLPDQQFYRWAGKKYLVLIELAEIEKVQPFSIDKSNITCTDDWLQVGDIKKVTVYGSNFLPPCR